MRVLWGSVLAVALALGSIGCGSSSDGGGGEVNSEAALRAFMQTVAFDLAEVLAEIAPRHSRVACRMIYGHMLSNVTRSPVKCVPIRRYV